MGCLSYFIKSFGRQFEDIIHMFDYFYKGDLDLYRLNFSLVTLVPKTDDAS
jgi:hypothetical protein